MSTNKALVSMTTQLMCSQNTVITVDQNFMKLIATETKGVVENAHASTKGTKPFPAEILSICYCFAKLIVIYIVFN